MAYRGITYFWDSIIGRYRVLAVPRLSMEFLATSEEDAKQQIDEFLNRNLKL